MLVLSNSSAAILILVATAGNVLGSTVNWWLGTKIEKYKDRKWFPVSEKRLIQAQSYYHKFGSIILLLSWLPVIGDPITLVSGVLKENIYKFLILVTLAKFGRYLVIYLSYLGLFN
ncbi:DedA family protein [Zophobihabitans entericus]|uniref:DedA family protein n=2 Tax=Zophobihabitans entericus TaxID=1635327 RepID=A0A6G9IDV5_9GAMM|nr:DedA family protein [Zophobihabitans entericus]